ncbi:MULTISPECIES: DUF4238 domain-containing protein [unclassified Novosphingobium]|uniref:DUF4238 domain-containing protein n=1 Tax=unclassified Novosphingobium TaxID=2644732 RepID=UPI00146C372E|nr:MULTISPECIES: DUF4238 domain-containing protein [unclassified Novosphingobium]NMN06723.1 hypothetical protein [Novosphingobium sp. SG919]NMN88826.1 hypothetical protein [Novosphingobium sp. SG916]
MTAGRPKRHHYVPQFYLRRFACADDANKVRVVERHGDVLAIDRKSIDRIGYEDALHDYVENGVAGSIEGPINHVIETPFSKGPTWKKIVEGQSAALSDADKVPIYGFARHLQRRNLETLRFIEAESTRFTGGHLDADLDEDEREMHAWIAASADHAHALFREGAMDTTIPADADTIKVMVCHSPVPFRTSTNPTLMISAPGRQSVFGAVFNDLRTWWLTLDRTCGAFIIAGGPPGLSHSTMPPDAARMINRQYLVQHANSMTVRYLLADDPYLDDDLRWAGYGFDRTTTHGARWQKRGGGE